MMSQRLSIVLVIGVMLIVTSCSGSSPHYADTAQLPSPDTSNEQLPNFFKLPTADGEWRTAETHRARKPAGVGSVDIWGIGVFTFDSSEVETVRPDIFLPGHFSIFDTLVQLDKQGDITLEYHFDGAIDTHVIDSINGEPHWWYEVRYSGGWYESNVFRMDMYPYKHGTDVRLFPKSDDYLARVCREFGDEIRRLSSNDGRVIIPEVIIDGPKTNLEFTDVEVTAHNTRNDMLQSGVVTALDILLSLGEQGKLSDIKITWYDSIGRADPIDSYWVEQIDEDIASGAAGMSTKPVPKNSPVFPEAIFIFHWMCGY